MNLTVSQIQLVIDGLLGQLYDLIAMIRDDRQFNDDDFVRQAKEIIDLLANFIRLKREKLAHE